MLHPRTLLTLYCGCLAGLVSLAISSNSANADPLATIPQVLPAPGIEISAEDRASIEAELKVLEAKIDKWRKVDSQLVDLYVPDAEIYAKAVSLALRFNEFYTAEHVALARQTVAQGLKRMEQLAASNMPWIKQHGLVVRGYRSMIDGSAQPMGLVIPEDLKLDKAQPVPLYVWLHGRGDKSTDLHFIAERQTKVGQIQPTDGIVLHVFGRHCLGFKSTAEIDIFEAINAVRLRYPIDPQRIALLGFSMGGAGAWHVGAHFADHFSVVHPGAGFVETRRYNNIGPDNLPPWYEQTLWHNYDVPDYVRNLFNVPVIAYSGENDKQKQAADVMAEAFAQQGKELIHLIGPGVGHQYEPETLKEVMKLVGAAQQAGRDLFPRQVTFQTRTLRYNQLFWVEVLRLNEHWQDTRVDAERSESGDTITVKTKNVQRLKLSVYTPESGPSLQEVKIIIDGETLTAPLPPRTTEWNRPNVDLIRGEHWQFANSVKGGHPRLAKAPGLQGPIDDVLLDPFLVVLPSKKSANTPLQRWVQFEQEHFLNRWRAVYRGEARVKYDKDVTEDDLEKYHLILWGEPQTNSQLKKIADKLPIHWTAAEIKVGEQTFDAAHHVPLLIYPNPLNQAKYVVLNSGPTHREGHDKTNSQQNPKLPDWAIIDIRQAPSATAPGKVAAADFFDEFWQLKPKNDHPQPTP